MQMKLNKPNKPKIDTPYENCSTVCLNPNPSNKGTKCFTKLKNFQLKNTKNLIMGHLNINSLSNKFESLKSTISSIFDLSLVSETKLDES